MIFDSSKKVKFRIVRHNFDAQFYYSNVTRVRNSA